MIFQFNPTIKVQYLPINSLQFIKQDYKTLEMKYERPIYSYCLNNNEKQEFVFFAPIFMKYINLAIM